MKKYVLLGFLVLLAIGGRAQDRYVTRTGQIRSFSQEKMEAINQGRLPSAWCKIMPHSGLRWRLFLQIATPPIQISESRFRVAHRNGMEPVRKPTLPAAMQPAFLSPPRFPH